MSILAIDPGAHMGCAKRNNDATIQTCVVTADHFKWLAENVPQHKTVVVEQFQATTINHYGLQTVEFVGGIAALCAEHNINFVRHTPQQRYPWAQRAEDYLRSQHKRFVVHEKDALAHLYTFEMSGR